MASKVSTHIRAYYRVTKPGIVRANLLTAIAGYLFGSRNIIQLDVLTGLGLGTALVIASGCVLNNIKDRELDAKMHRTNKRELVTGQISLKHAILYAGILGTLGLLILLLLTNILTSLIGIGALVAYVWIYGYAKRYTNYATEIGTIPGSASIVAGYTAATNSLNAITIGLFLVMAFWQMAHFLAITVFRSKEYNAAGISLLPHRIGIAATQRRILLMILAFTVGNFLLAINANTSITFLLAMLLGGGFWLYVGLRDLGVIKPDTWARKQFGLSLLILLGLCTLLSLDYFLP